MSYDLITRIYEHDFTGKSVLILGGGKMGKEFSNALLAMNIHNFTIITANGRTAMECRSAFECRIMNGGYQANVLKGDVYDLVIIATPVHELIPAVRHVISCGNTNILVEKPCSVYSSELRALASELEDSGVRVRVGYNRRTYPNLWKLKELAKIDGGITSCRYTFTEILRTIIFDNNHPDAYERWGITNSLHVISTAHFLIGMPNELSRYLIGGLSWHPIASRFVGAGLTEKDILFSYLADWDSAGRWGIEIMTPQNAYRLVPLEKLFCCPKSSFEWELVETTSAFPDVKQGIAEEVAIMLYPEMEKTIPLVTVHEAAEYTGLADQIFGYDSHKST
ncbi:MAG: Gfo/Idh/MocA family oxidoreductase [Desulfobacterales bacterium]|nr:Gfo/Idh/MocA family oxidoreductase [Desulfobacterales bacterium]